jgi:hypothetical protein
MKFGVQNTDHTEKTESSVIYQYTESLQEKGGINKLKGGKGEKGEEKSAGKKIRSPISRGWEKLKNSFKTISSPRPLPPRFSSLILYQ